MEAFSLTEFKIKELNKKNIVLDISQLDYDFTFNMSAYTIAETKKK